MPNGKGTEDSLDIFLTSQSQLGQSLSDVVLSSIYPLTRLISLDVECIG